MAFSGNIYLSQFEPYGLGAQGAALSFGMGNLIELFDPLILNRAINTGLPQSQKNDRCTDFIDGKLILFPFLYLQIWQCPVFPSYLYQPVLVASVACTLWSLASH